MSATPFRILYCHCAFARVVPADVKAGVLAATRGIRYRIRGGPGPVRDVGPPGPEAG